MFYAPTEQDIEQAQAHLAVLTKRRELCAKRETIKAQLAEIEAQLQALPVTLGPAPRRPGALERWHQRVGLA